MAALVDHGWNDPERWLMKQMIALLSAGALSLVTGAIAGSTIPTEPLSSEGNSLADLAPPPVQRYSAAVQGTPNHYPLKTAGGVVPVEELSMHGLYRERYRLFSEAVYEPEDELSLVELAEMDEPIEIVPMPEPRHARNYADSGARMIDVAQELSRLR